MYAWDEALQHLYEHICVLETDVIQTSSMELTEELHMIRAHLLHYSSLVVAFREIILFILETPNPALTPAQRSISTPLLKRECKTLLHQIERLGEEHKAQEGRLTNVIDLVFSSVNILESRAIKKMTEATVKDSAAMKQIAYVTMVFLPAHFVSEFFNMNVRTLNPTSNGSLAVFFIVSCVLFAVTFWVIIAFQSRFLFDKNTPYWKRLGWPLYFVYYAFRKALYPEKSKVETRKGGTQLLYDLSVQR